MTMRTILTAAAIISSAGPGVGQSPATHASSSYTSTAPLSIASAQRRDAYDAVVISMPPAPWAKADPADSLYRLAREAMSRGDYKRAAEIFARIAERSPQSPCAGRQRYFEAYSLYRSGGDEDLSTARDRLTLLKDRFPAIAKKDGDPLLTRVCGELAKRGDESCAASIDRKAQGDSDVTGGETRIIGQGRNCSPDADEANDDP